MALQIEEAASAQANAGTALAIDLHRICSTNELPSDFRLLRTLGVVRGVTVRSRNIGADIGAGFKALGGGEIKQMTKLCEDSRKEAFERMVEQAMERGANGVVAVRYDQNSIMPGITEVIAYGVAVSDGSIPTSGIADQPEGGMRCGQVCTSNELPNYTVHHSLGVVNGITVRTRNAAAQIGAGFKSMVGGEIKTYTTMCERARKEAYSRMVAEAVERGADGIVAMRYNTSDVQDGVTEVLAFGTAVTSGALATPLPHGDLALPTAMVTTASTLPELGSQLYSLGVVQGITVRSKNVIANFGAGLKSVFGGESRTWLGLCKDTRLQAMERMLEQARERGAKGVVAMRYDCNQISPDIIEVIAYGTAVSDQPSPQLAASANGQESRPEQAPHRIPGERVSTDLEIAGYAARSSLGLVRGISVRSCNFVRNIGAGWKSIVGGEIRNFSKMCNDAREEACERMMQHASEMGADGIAGMRFESNTVEPGVIEVVAYGTAVSERDAAAAPTSTSEGTIAHSMVTTTNELLGHQMPRSLGLAQGITVRSRNVFRNIGASLGAAFVGGERKTWTELCEAARKEAFDRLLKNAAELGATGLVALRYETEEIAPHITEVFAYATAVA
mmetsp:Transcript_148215/g.385166  ORF Transcript_148215/g.385166 Transcript_148215/m.385166 type:complete len:618 (-) Transcript_148215:168-2021(-)